MTEDNVHHSSSVNGDNNKSSPSSTIGSLLMCSLKSDLNQHRKQMNLITAHQRNLTFSSSSSALVKSKISILPQDLPDAINDSNNNNDNNNETMSSPCHSLSSMSIIRPLVELVDGKILHHGDVLGPIPNLFKWLQSELSRVEKSFETSLLVKNSGSTVVEMALTKEEQNLEIVFYNEQYYFEVIRSFRVQQKNDSMDSFQQQQFDLKIDFGDEKPKAWFCKDIEERISTMRPAQTWLNGKELFCCLMCNHFSFYSNHLMLHIMFDCPKKTNDNNNNNRNRLSTKIVEDNAQNLVESSNNKRFLNNDQESKNNRKQIRSFDIMSLLNKNDVLQHEKNEDVCVVDVVDNEEDVDVETLDTYEENLKNSFQNHNNNQMKECPQNKKTKRQMDLVRQSIPPHLYHQPSVLIHNSKAEPIRKNNNARRYSNKNINNMTNNKISPLNIMTGSSNHHKSAFKKLKNNQANKKLINSSSKPMTINGGGPNSSSNQFISNINLTNFYNQLADTTTVTNGSNNPLFPFANFFRTTNPSSVSSSTTTNTSSMSPTSFNSESANTVAPFSPLYPFRSSNQNSRNHTNGPTKVPNKIPLGQPSTSNLFEATTSTNATIGVGSFSLESNSPTLSESSSSSSNSPTSCNANDGKKEKLGNDSSESSSMIQLLPQSAQSTMANNPLFNLPPYFMPPTSAAASNPLITSLYLLSPSLTALSYQASNVCAYCNTAFRMTSDLVYHMRSHHKRTRTADEMVNKKRRDDQLRCHICNETFRERHHLTRHMTSHQ